MTLKAIDTLTAADIQSLIAREGKEIEYKRSLPTSIDADKREFLCDVSSLANTIGGDLIYGVEEVDGVPTSFPGLSGVQQDQAKLTLESLVRDGIEPRLPGVQMRFIDRNQTTVFLVVRVPRSWLAPHRVTFRGHDRFYARNSAGKFDLDVGQLREAFLLGQTIETRMRSFLAERYAVMQERRTPAVLYDGGILSLHVLPIQAFTHHESIDIAGIQPPILPTIPSKWWRARLAYQPRWSLNDLRKRRIGTRVHNSFFAAV